MLRQFSKYGCGIYAVVNALSTKGQSHKYSNFITQERLQTSINGVSCGQLSRWLQDDGHDLFIDSLYCDSFTNKLPKVWTEITLQGPEELSKDARLPLLIQVDLNGIYHLVGARLRNDYSGKSNFVTLLDSLKPAPIECTLDYVNRLYKKPFAIYTFNHLSTGSFLFL